MIMSLNAPEPMPNPSPENTGAKPSLEDIRSELGRIAYDAYFDSVGGKLPASGAVMPPWEGLRFVYIKAWEAAAAAVYAAVVK